ncbi:MAG: BMP family protein, partial [Bacillota bacterium]
MAKIKRLLAGLAIVALVTALAVAGCSKAPEAQDDGKTKVAVLFPGVVYDQSWCQQGYEGLIRARDELGVEIAYTEKVHQSEQIEIMRNYAKQGYDIIIGHGGEYMDACETVAKEYPNVQFVCTNGKRAGGNVTSIGLNYFDMGYLAGIMAGKMTKTNKIAMLVGEPIQISIMGMDGYEMGAKAVNPNVEVTRVETGSWEDVNIAREACLALIDNGVDVLYHVLDAADVGLYTAAQDRGVMAIGLYKDVESVAPKAIIGSTLGSPAKLIYDACSGALLNGKVNWIGAVDPEVVNYVITDDNVPQEVKDL